MVSKPNAVNHVEGEIVRITEKKRGHQFEIGSLVKITYIGRDRNGIPYNYRGKQIKGEDIGSWAFEDDECTYYVYAKNNRQAASLLDRKY